MSEEKKEQSTTPESGLDQISLDDENKEELIAVSYTHLTLPTIA